MKLVSKYALAVLVGSIFIAAGCAPQSRVAAEYGDSVRQVTKAQIYDMDAATNPDPAGVTGGHPDHLNNAVEAHRTGTAGASSEASPVTVNVGSTGN